MEKAKEINMKTVLQFKGIGLILAGFLVIMISVNAMTVKQSELKDQTEDGFSNIEPRQCLVNARYTIPVMNLKQKLTSELSRKGIKKITKENKESASQAVIDCFNREYGNARSQYSMKRFRVNEANNWHFVLNQFIDDIPVLGGIVALHMHADGELFEITGSFLQGNEPVTAPSIDSSGAVELALRTLKPSSKLVEHRQPELVIIGCILAFRLYFNEPGTKGSWEMIVDARTGEVLQKAATLYRSIAPTSMPFLTMQALITQSETDTAPPGYPDQGNVATITGNRLEREGGEEVTINGWYDSTDSRFYLFNASERWLVIDQSVVPDTESIYSGASNNWGTSNRAIISLAYNLERVQEFASDSMGLNSFDDEGTIVTAEYENDNTCWWNSIFDKMEIGNGYDESWPQDAQVVTDCIGHEYAHGISYFGFGNTLVPESRAVMEAYSDIFSACIEQTVQIDGRDKYVNTSRQCFNGTGEWLFGEDCTFADNSDSSWMRNMQETENSPILYTIDRGGTPLYNGTGWGDQDYYNHSLIMSHAFFLLSEGVMRQKKHDDEYLHNYGPFKGLGIGTARRIAWGSILDGRTQYDPLFKDRRNAWLAESKDLGHNTGTVAQVWAAVGVVNRLVGTPPTGSDTLPGVPEGNYYSTISNALAAADAGDFIYIYPGIYVEGLSIDSADITLVGQNWDVTSFRGQITVNSGGSGFTLAGFNLNGLGTYTPITINSATNVSICNNKITNCDTGIATNIKCQIMGNVISASDVAMDIYNTGQCIIKDNEILTSGIILDYCMANEILYNRFDGITDDAIYITNGAYQKVQNNFIRSASQYSIAGATSLLNITENVLTSSSGVSFDLSSSNSGYIYHNNFSGPSYSFDVPGSFYWDNGSQEGSFWSNYVSGGSLPHEGKDYYPLSSRPVSPFFITSSDGTVRFITDVEGNNVKITDTVSSGSQSGLRIGTAASLSSTGILQCNQLLTGSGKWLDDEENLDGCFVWKNPEGKAMIVVAPDSTVRIRGQMTPKM
ncbi:MAG: M4 family metallopeptidase [Bacteroidales bacterium]|nr:M4 family metallopeptidase [Bacteroidales bacterium]